VKHWARRLITCHLSPYESSPIGPAFTCQSLHSTTLLRTNPRIALSSHYDLEGRVSMWPRGMLRARVQVSRRRRRRRRRLSISTRSMCAFTSTDIEQRLSAYSFATPCMILISSLVISRRLLRPRLARLESVSASRQLKTCLTPSSPPIVSPYTYGLPTSTALAPSATALSTSEPVRMPLSKSTVSPDSLTLSSAPISASASREATAPSSWRPPWLETMMPSMPCDMAR
jgi:hypothetical protein